MGNRSFTAVFTGFMARVNLTLIFLLFLFSWTLLIAVIGYLSYRQASIESRENLIRSARDTYNRDLVYRRWASMHGGVYAPVTEQTPPNPYLSDLPERDITTTTGKKLTLINPAYMTRQVHELGKSQYGLRGHITSLNPLRPQNAPDDWEAMALDQFKTGINEVSSLDTIDGEVFFRLMCPMKTEEGCLKCHARQGYRVGDIRGGISISVPMEPVNQSISRQMGIMIPSYAGIWFIGLIGILFTRKSLSVQFRQRREAEELIRQSEEKFKSLITQMQQGVAVHEVICNDKGEVVDYRFLDMNQSFEKITGLSREQVLGKRVLEVMPRTEKSWIQRYGKVAMTGEPEYFENFASELGKYFSVVAYQTRPGQFAVIIIDVTHYKEIESEIKTRNEQLELMSAQKDKFFSIIAHDLKNPFNTLIGFSDVLGKQVRSKDYEAIEKIAGFIQHASKNTYDLLVNLLEWSASQTGRIVFSPEMLDLTGLISDVVKLLSPSARQKSITLLTDIFPVLPVMADKAMVNTILRNLVTNAIKFTKPGGEIRISVKEDGKGVTVSVTDNGVGISATDLEGLFRIDKSHSTEGTQNEKGTGLGLLLCKEFAEKHGGMFWAESQLGKGSSFYFTIPKVSQKPEVRR